MGPPQGKGAPRAGLICPSSPQAGPRPGPHTTLHTDGWSADGPGGSGPLSERGPLSVVHVANLGLPDHLWLRGPYSVDYAHPEAVRRRGAILLDWSALLRGTRLCLIGGRGALQSSNKSQSLIRFSQKSGAQLYWKKSKLKCPNASHVTAREH